MISVEGLKVEFGVKPLFADASFVINDKDRIALVGKNGAGKSTMLKILCGQQKPTAGNVSVPTDCLIGYLPQVMILQDDTTVREEAQKAFADITRMKERIDRMNQELAERTDYESESYLALIEKYTTEHERYMMLGAENYEAEIERTLMGLGFLRSDFERPTSEFSGGRTIWISNRSSGWSSSWRSRRVLWCSSVTTVHLLIMCRTVRWRSPADG